MYRIPSFVPPRCGKGRTVVAWMRSSDGSRPSIRVRESMPESTAALLADRTSTPSASTARYIRPDAVCGPSIHHAGRPSVRVESVGVTARDSDDRASAAATGSSGTSEGGPIEITGSAGSGALVFAGSLAQPAREAAAMIVRIALVLGITGIVAPRSAQGKRESEGPLRRRPMARPSRRRRASAGPSHRGHARRAAGPSRGCRPRS